MIRQSTFVSSSLHSGHTSQQPIDGQLYSFDILLEDIPLEIFYKILSNLPKKDLWNCRTLSRKLLKQVDNYFRVCIPKNRSIEKIKCLVGENGLLQYILSRELFYASWLKKQYQQEKAITVHRAFGETIVNGCDDGTIQVWDFTKGDSKPKYTLRGHTVPVVSFAVDGNMIVSGCADGNIQIWDLATTKKPIHTLKGFCNDPVKFLAVVEKMLVSGYSNKVTELWNLTTGRSINVAHAHSLKLCRMTCLVVVNKWFYAGYSDGVLSKAKLIPRKGKLHLELRVSCLFSPSSKRKYPNGIVYLDATGKMLACGFRDGTVLTWDITKKKPKKKYKLQAHYGQIVSIVFADNILGVGFSDGIIQIWYLTKKKVYALNGNTKKGDNKLIQRLKIFSNKLISVYNNGTFRFWNLDERNLKQIFLDPGDSGTVKAKAIYFEKY